MPKFGLTFLITIILVRIIMSIPSLSEDLSSLASEDSTVPHLYITCSDGRFTKAEYMYLEVKGHNTHLHFVIKLPGGAAALNNDENGQPMPAGQISATMQEVLDFIKLNAIKKVTLGHHDDCGYFATHYGSAADAEREAQFQEVEKIFRERCPGVTFETIHAVGDHEEQQVKFTVRNSGDSGSDTDTSCQSEERKHGPYNKHHTSILAVIPTEEDYNKDIKALKSQGLEVADIVSWIGGAKFIADWDSNGKSDHLIEGLRLLLEKHKSEKVILFGDDAGLLNRAAEKVVEMHKQLVDEGFLVRHSSLVVTDSQGNELARSASCSPGPA